MKKILILVLTVFLISGVLTPISAAAPGTSAGDFYYTDIVTYLWHTPVNSINIGGVTLIDAESMRHYGFTVNWYQNERKLEITDNQTEKISSEASDGSLLDMKYGRVGSAAGKYYHTDIKTTLNGKEIVSYNIGGRTFIGAEAMRSFGYDVIWNGSDRTLHIQKSLVTISYALDDITRASGELYTHIGKGGIEEDNRYVEAVTKKYTVTLKVPSSWRYLKDIRSINESYTEYHNDNHGEPYISSIHVIFFPSEYDLPDAMYPYNTRDSSYSETQAEMVLLNEKFTLSGREVLSEHIDGGVSYSTGLQMYSHNYYIRVEDDFVIRVMTESSSMDGEDERRQVIDSIVLSY